MPIFNHRRKSIQECPDTYEENHAKKKWVKLLPFVKINSGMENKIDIDYGRGSPSVLSQKGSRRTGSYCSQFAEIDVAFSHAEEGNYESLKSILMLNKRLVCSRNNSNETLLHVAAFNGKQKIVELLLDYKYEATTFVDDAGNTPMNSALEGCDDPGILELLGNTNIVNQPNNDDQCPIHKAVNKCRHESLTYLLKRQDVDVNKGGKYGRTPLHYSAMNKCHICVAIILDCERTKPCFQCDGGYTAMHCFIINGSKKSLEVFINKVGQLHGYTAEGLMNYSNRDLKSPLHVAVTSGDNASVKLCLELGSRIDRQIEAQDNLTPLHLAASLGYPCMLNILYCNSPRELWDNAINMEDANGMLPIHHAAVYDHVPAIRCLIEMGSQVDCKCASGFTPLMMAMIKGANEAVKFLVAHSNVCMLDKFNRNLLHLGLIFGTPSLSLNSIAPELIQKMVNQNDDFGCTPIHYAVVTGKLQIIDVLSKYGVKLTHKSNSNEMPLHYAAKFGRYNSCLKLIQSSVGRYMINSHDGEDRLAVMLAAMNGHEKVVKLLLSIGSLIVHKDYKGHTALHLAALGGYTRTMKILIDNKNTLIEMTDKEGNTPFHFAARENHPGAVKLLLMNDCLITMNKYGMTAVDYAIEFKCRDVLEAMNASPRWNELMSYYGPKSEPIFMRLVNILPDIALGVMDNCITESGHNIKSKDYSITYEFKYLDEACCEETTPIEDRPFRTPMPGLNVICDSDQIELLTHPLCLMYLDMKWKIFGLKMCLFTSFFTGIFTMCLTFLAFTQLTKISVPNNIIIRNPANFTEELDYYRRNITFWDKSACLFCVLHSVLSLILMIPKLRFNSRTKDEMIELVTYVILYLNTIFYCVVHLTPGIPTLLYTISIYVIALSVFLTWFSVLFTLQHLGGIGIYITMYLEIFVTLSKLVLVFFVLMLAFSLTGSILFRNLQFIPNPTLNSVNFQDMFTSFSKVFVMMLGEIDMTSTYIKNYSADNLNFIDLMFIVIFVVFIPLLFINLTIGLAVGDITRLQRNSEKKRIQMQINLYTLYETDFWKKKFYNYVVKSNTTNITVFPNNKKEKCFTTISNLLRTDEDSSVVEQKRQEIVKKLAVDGEKSKCRLKRIETLIGKQEEMLQLILNHLEIISPYANIDEGMDIKEITPLIAQTNLCQANAIKSL